MEIKRSQIKNIEVNETKEGGKTACVDTIKGAGNVNQGHGGKAQQYKNKEARKTTTVAWRRLDKIDTKKEG